MRRAPARLGRDARGTAALQFALVAPVMLMLMMGLGELAYQGYIQSVLTGAVQKAGRDSGIQGNGSQSDAIDAVVQAQVRRVIASATFVSTRANFDNYSTIAGEPFTDSKDSKGNYDGRCDNGESYIDLNSNQSYDLDLSASGQGGANDVTKYTMQVTYHRLFPAQMFGWGQYATLSATTILKNQPYATQSVNGGTTVRTCA